MRKLIFTLIIILAIAFVGLGVLRTMYLHSENYTQDTFGNNIKVNGVDISGLSVDEAQDTLTKAWNDKKIIVTGSMDEKLATYTDFECTYDIEESLENLKSEYPIHMAIGQYLHIPVSINMTMKVADYSKDFEETVKNSEFLNREGLIKTQDAYVDTSTTEFKIVKEVYGNNPDKKAFMADVIKAIETNQLTINYDEQKYIQLPEVTSDDEELIAYQEFCLKYLTAKITYVFGDDSVTIDMDDMMSFFKDDMSGDIDSAAVKQYVANLADKYDTVGRTRKFKSLTGKTVKVTGGTYGWQIDQESEIEKLTKNLKAGKDVEREPVYAVTGSGEYSSSGNDIGNTYVDVDISEQHVTYFKNGKKVFECDCVTGNETAGHSTPTGTFYIINHHRNLVLRGNNDDGSKYESPVEYWCGFYSSTHGFHDADWRSSFGGSIYVSNGSHGCINMPPSKMPKFYKAVSNGDPVVVHK